MPPVVDANVFIRGRNRPFGSAYTTPDVVKELKSDSAKLNFDLEKVDVVQPEQKYVDTVVEKSDEINSPTSKTDEELLSLALQKDEKLITDDKALQNLALHLQVEFEPFLQDEIDREREWELICENCGAEASDGECSRCGSTQLTRKPV